MKLFVLRGSRHGRGVFAAKAIACGDVLVTVPRTYALIPYAQLLCKRVTDNPLQISPRRYLDWRAPGVTFNHSCAPNVGLTSYPQLVFVALRDIAVGEELRWDYSTSIDKDTECDFVCDCGAESCRKTIGGFYWLPKKLQASYKKLGIVQRYLLKEQ